MEPETSRLSPPTGRGSTASGGEQPCRILDSQQPWRGLDYYVEADQSYFFGRWDDSRKLYRLIPRETLTVLFGESGLGKTSLLHAGVFPLLREAGYFPVRIRLIHEQESDSHRVAEQIERKISEEAERTGYRFSRPSGTGTLLEFFQGCRIWNRSVELLTPVIVLDQFEEIFTHGRGKPSTQPFLDELAELIESSAPGLHLVGDRSENPYHVVLSLREDYLAHLEDLKGRIPSLAVNRFRLLPMNGSQALECVLEPARQGDLVTRRVAERIVLFAAGKAHEAQHAASEEDLQELVRDAKVEPFLLSLFCEQLNLRRLEPPRQKQITSDLLTVAGQGILERFYEDRIEDFSPRVRRFVEEGLLTARGDRKQVGLGEAEDRWKVTESDVDELVDRRLLRREDVLGRPGAELIHDVLCPVIRESRDRRRWRKRMVLGGAVAVVLLVGIIGALSLAGRFALLVEDLRETEQQLEAKIDQLEKTESELRREIVEKEAATREAEQAKRDVEAREDALVEQVGLKEAAQRRAEARSRDLQRAVRETVQASAYLFDRLGLDLVAADERERLSAFEEAATWAVGHSDSKVRTRGHFFRGVTSPPDEELDHFAAALGELERAEMHDVDDERLRIQLYRRQGRAEAELGRLGDSQESFEEAVEIGESLLLSLGGGAGESDLLLLAKAHDEVAQVALELAFVSRALGDPEERVAEAFAKPGRLRDRADQLRQDHSRLSLNRSAQAGGAKAAGDDFMGSASEFLALLARGTGLVVHEDRRGTLAEGGRRWIPVPRELAGQPALIFGLCDDGCSDLDLRLFDDDGTELASDSKDTDFPSMEYKDRGSLIEVAMERCGEPTCEYGLLVMTASTAPAGADGFSAEDFVESKLDLALQFFAEGGGAESGRWRGTLESGGLETIVLPPRAIGTDAVVLALCDQGCAVLDLVARDEEGREITADRLDDSAPMVEAPPKVASVEVLMRECVESPCHYAVSLVEGERVSTSLSKESQSVADEVPAEEFLGQLLDLMVQQRSASPGAVELYRAIRPLAPGASERLRFEGGEPGQVLIVDGFCEEACSDLDIALYGEDGQEVGADRLPDNVPIVEVPAGAYEVEVSMEACSAPECFYGLLIIGADESTPLQPMTEETMVSTVLDLIAGQRAEEGAVEIQRAAGSLAPGATERFVVKGGEEGFLSLDGTCDQNCTNLDLVVFGEDGEEVGADRLDDDVPIVELPAGRYEAEVSMVSCSAPECAYGVVVHKAETASEGAGLSGEGASGEALVDSQLDMAGRLFPTDAFEEVERWHGTLAPGEIDMVELPARGPGDTAVVVAACDEHCDTLDLVLRDAAGTEVDADRAADSAPMLRAPAEAATADVLMTGCSRSGCAYGVMLLQGDMPASGSEPGRE